jgi:hypothetical protein
VTIILCPGIHSPKLTQDFLHELSPDLNDGVVFPTDDYPAYSAWHLIRFLDTTLDEEQIRAPVLFIGFSAGVVAAIATAWYLQTRGRTVTALIAIDGWGVPLRGTFPIHRISHDAFTHWSSTLGETLSDCFYADPSADHLDMWRSPTSVNGQWVQPSSDNSLRHCWGQPWGAQSPSPSLSASDFLKTLLKRYRD